MRRFQCNDDHLYVKKNTIFLEKSRPKLQCLPYDIFGGHKYCIDPSNVKSEYRVIKGEYRVIKSEYRVIKSECRVIKGEYRVIKSEYRVIKSEYRVMKSLLSVYNRVVKQTKNQFLTFVFGCSKEPSRPSHRDGTFEYPQHMFW